MNAAGAMGTVLLAAGLAGCQTMRQTETAVKAHGRTAEGQTIRVFTLVNANGLKARISEFGATLISLETPDRDGKLADITLGYDTPAGWLGNSAYFGATAGRYANRIAHGKFSLDGTEHVLATNSVSAGIPCHLHGGVKGFDKVLWSGVPMRADGAQGVVMGYVSPDGEEGYPGTLTATVTYLLTDRNELKVLFEATTDKPTVVNLCHHSYWNLSGNPANSVENHTLMLNADRFLPTNAGLIPTGEFTPVKGTPMDFTQPFLIGARIHDDYEPLRFGGGYDHCWCINGEAGQLKLAADLYEATAGRGMRILTDQPGIQFYSGNFLDGTMAGKNGILYGHRGGLCLETQRYPDSPNHPEFPSSVLRPGEVYRHTMVHEFYAR